MQGKKNEHYVYVLCAYFCMKKKKLKSKIIIFIAAWLQFVCSFLRLFLMPHNVHFWPANSNRASNTIQSFSLAHAITHNQEDCILLFFVVFNCTLCAQCFHFYFTIILLKTKTNFVSSASKYSVCTLHLETLHV